MHGIFIEPPPPYTRIKYQCWYLTLCCGLEVQIPTQALRSFKGNTFDLNPKWSRTLPSLTEVPGWVSATQTHSRVSNINVDIWRKLYGGGSLWISHEKYIKDGKVLDHLEFKSKVLHGPLTDLSSWVGFCISSPQLGVKYQLWYLIIIFMGYS
jgi:hypothetical protein